MDKNIPDRIKLVSQFIVFTLATCFIFFIILVISPEQFINDMYAYRLLIILVILTVSIFIQGVIFIYRWKKLLQREKSGELPDMKDMKNITPRQLILFLFGFPFLIGGVVVFQLYSKLAGVLCIIPYLVLWVVDIVNVKKRYKKILEIENDKTKE